jgi:hypothetical protein
MLWRTSSVKNPLVLTALSCNKSELREGKAFSQGDVADNYLSPLQNRQAIGCQAGRVTALWQVLSGMVWLAPC